MNYLPLLPGDFSHENKPIIITGSRARELINLHQLKEGLEIRALSYNHSVGSATVIDISKDHLVLVYKSSVTDFKKNPINLIIGLCRPQTVKKVLAAAQAFGVAAIEFIKSDTSEASYQDASIWEESNLIYELSLAMAQTGDPIAPKIKFGDDIVECNFEPADYACYLADLREDIQSQSNDNQKPVLLAVGPEKGWSDREKDWFYANDFQIISFGSRILRIEQAVLAGLGQLSSRLYSSNSYQ